MIRDLLFTQNPYDGFDYKKYQYKPVPEWYGESEELRQLVRETIPSTAVTIIEVGTWKGDSAICMADEMVKNAIDGEVVCVDTWLGGAEFWTDKAGKEHFNDLDIINGYPSVYYQFLANVCHKNLQKIITPFPQTSVIASRVFKYYNIKADIVYIDASHEYESVTEDLNAWWDIVNKIICGDDIMLVPGVSRAVNDWASKKSLKINAKGNKWWIYK